MGGEAPGAHRRCRPSLRRLRPVVACPSGRIDEQTVSVDEVANRGIVGRHGCGVRMLLPDGRSEGSTDLRRCCVGSDSEDEIRIGIVHDLDPRRPANGIAPHRRRVAEATVRTVPSRPVEARRK